MSHIFLTYPSESSCQYASVSCPKLWSKNFKENSCLSHQDISSPLDGRDGYKAVDKTFMKVSAKIGEAKSEKELEWFNPAGFDCDQELGEPHNMRHIMLF